MPNHRPEWQGTGSRGEGSRGEGVKRGKRCSRECIFSLEGNEGETSLQIRTGRARPEGRRGRFERGQVWNGTVMQNGDGRGKKKNYNTTAREENNEKCGGRG
jgi:hypothetical protein